MRPDICITLLILTLASSCRLESFEPDGPSSNESMIHFDVRHTRSRLVDGESFYDSFGVIGHSFTGTWTESASADLMHCLEVRAESSWKTGVRWPGGKRKARFFAYSPFTAQGLTLSSRAEMGSPKMHYSVPLDVAEQVDLVVASTGELSEVSGQAVSLSFDHALTAVQFICGEETVPGTVRSIAVKGACSKGTYDFRTGSWTSLGDTATFVQDIQGIVSLPGDPLAVGDKSFILLPQVLPEEAEIQVVFDDGLEEHVLRSSIAGSEWMAGTTVVYSISSSSISRTYTFEITEALPCGHEGGSFRLDVESWSCPGSSSTETALGWSASFVEENPLGGYDAVQAPDWITGIPDCFSGEEVVSGFDVTIAPQSPVHVNERDEALRNAPEVSPTYDLSTRGGTAARQTSNCYMVDAPGTYKLPLVYGNAIDFVKNSVDGDNLTSYHFDESEDPYIEWEAYTGVMSHMLHDFINHLGNPITSPYIPQNQGCAPLDAVVVWQDAEDLVCEPSIEGNFLKFKIRRESIRQGNSVVAVRDRQGRIMWSWHIWVTDLVPETVVRFGVSPEIIVDGMRYWAELVDFDLGWCDNGAEEYGRRSALVRFTQEGSGRTVIREIVQESHSVDLGGRSPNYQWGRKDPMMSPVRNGSDQDKKMFRPSGQEVTSQPIAMWMHGAAAISRGIMNPDTFNTNRLMDGLYTNLWSTRTGLMHSYDQVKSIYDPCPPGLMTSLMLTPFFILNGPEEASTAGGVWDEERKGYLVPGEVGGETFFYCQGFRDADTGRIRDAGESCCYWSTFGEEYVVDFAMLSVIGSKSPMEEDAFYNYYLSIPKGRAYPIRPMVEH